MEVYLLYDYGDLVGIYGTPEDAERDAEKCRKEARESIGEDELIEVVPYVVKE